MKRVLHVAFMLIALVVGGVFALLAVSMIRVAGKAHTIGLHADWYVLLWARVWTALYRVPWDVYLGVLRIEGASVSTGGAYPVGDEGDLGGPAMGPGQVLRRNLYAAREALLPPFKWIALPNDLADWEVREDLTFPRTASHTLWTHGTVWASVRLLRSEYARSNDWLAAVRHYNGSGPAAEAYAERVRADVSKLGGSVT